MKCNTSHALEAPACYPSITKGWFQSQLFIIVILSCKNSSWSFPYELSGACKATHERKSIADAEQQRRPAQARRTAAVRSLMDFMNETRQLSGSRLRVHKGRHEWAAGFGSPPAGLCIRTVSGPGRGPRHTPTPKQSQTPLKANFSPSHLLKSTHSKKKKKIKTGSWSHPSSTHSLWITILHQNTPSSSSSSVAEGLLLFSRSSFPFCRVSDQTRREAPDAQNVTLNASPSGLSPQCRSGVMTLVRSSARERWSIRDQTWLLSSCQGFLSPLMCSHSWPAPRPSLRSTHCAAVPLTPTPNTTQSHSQSQDTQLPESTFRIKKHEVGKKILLLFF